jgi:hypothetical protein
MAQRSEEVQRWSETLQRNLMKTTDALYERFEKTDDLVEITIIQKKVDVVGKFARTGRSVRVLNGPIRVAASEAPEILSPVTSEPASEAAPKDEAPMNDRNNWTPERETALRAEVDRRLEKLYRPRECKGEGDGDAGGYAGGMLPQPPAGGASPTPPG